MKRTAILLSFAVIIAVFVSISDYLSGQNKFEETEIASYVDSSNSVQTEQPVVNQLAGFNRRTETVKSDFRNRQKQFGRVQTAFAQKEDFINTVLSENNIAVDDMNILIIAYKSEKLFDVYAKNIEDSSYKKILTYDICKSSGQLGPKRKKGDKQVPEGFYYINKFNPVSNYYLSLGINYPNQSDRIISTARDLGGDIFVHGACVTIGCLPLTDDKIKEVYLLAVQARQNGQLRIPVYIFPFQMTDENMVKYNSLHKNDPDLLDFWANLKSGYDKFSLVQNELSYTIDDNGDYVFAGF